MPRLLLLPRELSLLFSFFACFYVDFGHISFVAVGGKFAVYFLIYGIVRLKFRHHMLHFGYNVVAGAFVKAAEKVVQDAGIHRCSRMCARELS